MGTYDDGLNFIPLLAQSPMNRKLSRRGTTVTFTNPTMVQNTSSTCYNGNYEGDSSMFSTANTNHNGIVRNDRLDLIETDSDTEYKRELERYQGPICATEEQSQPRRLFNHYKDRLLADMRVQKLIIMIDQLQRNYYFQRLYEGLCLGIAFLLYVLRWLLLNLVNICNWSRGFFRSKLFLRQAARRLLWSMTVAKCGDASFFGLIVVATPLLFAVSVCGFLLSTYGAVKEWLQNICYFIRGRVF